MWVASALEVSARRAEGPGLRSAEEFQAIFEGKYGLKPGPKAYRSMIELFDRAGKVKTVDKLYRKAQSEGVDLGVGTGQHQVVLEGTILKKTAVKLASVLAGEREERRGGMLGSFAVVTCARQGVTPEGFTPCDAVGG